MPVPTTIDQLSTTAASNYPQGSDSPSTLDDTQRAHGSFIAKIRDLVGLGTGTYVPATAASNMGVALSGSLSASSGSSLVGFIQSGTGAVATTVQVKNRETISSADYGVVGDGTTDDTAALVVADAAAASLKKTLEIIGTPLISSTVTVTAPKWMFQGSHTATEGTTPTSYIKKKATMTTDALLLGANTIIEGGGVVYASGATGDGIHITGNSSRLRNVSVIGVGKATTSGNGIRIGKDAAISNANSWLLESCNVAGMSGHGIYIHDKPGFSPDANAGNAIGCFANNNGGDGIHCENAALNTFTGCLAEGNTGYGIVLGASTASATTFCYNNVIVGGDYEANTAGQLVINPGARDSSVIVNSYGVTVTDNGYLTKKTDLIPFGRKTFTPGLVGSTGTDRTPASYSITGSTMTITDVAHGYTNGQYIWTSGTWPSTTMVGMFIVANATANTYDITLRSDLAYYLPTGTGTFSGAKTRLSGTYSIAVGSYNFEGSKVYFESTLLITATTGITGNLKLILPFVSANINGGNLYGFTAINYINGLTFTGSLSALLSQDGTINLPIYQNMVSAGAPAVLTNAGLTAPVTLVVSGSYYWQ